MRRRRMQGRADGCIRSALAGARKKARVCVARSVLRTAGEGKLRPVVRPAERLGEEIPAGARRTRRTVEAPGTRDGAVGAVGAFRRRRMGGHDAATARGSHRGGVAALGHAAPRLARESQSANAGIFRRGPRRSGDVQSWHEGRRDGNNRAFRRCVERRAAVLHRLSRKRRSHRRGHRSE